ncbi:NUDIX hydrolase [Vallitalea sp.]|jgi:8-oxo-dGTP diphosphatase|uniref:NUDIX hydrolase n=1 Tax=Vallitalea sp. TaxID=1882829 RepID=UPI0025D408CF|nr:NUDIX domain-containing protein [Vallitalea sp.]MCT4685967.1 NUDIX domain-containing protein [Vallitalea sp.]
MKVDFYDLNSHVNKLKYVVIQARYQGQWIFVRHKDRTTWEIAGGHIEKNETVDNAAIRELREETGALDFQLIPICNYSVEEKGVESFGRLYFGEVNELGNLEYEIVEITLCNDLPRQLTYEKIQPDLYQKVIEYLMEN